ncbi:YHYH protein-domain-containing protein [Hyaloraphidium curvatum]|nr:YHYH protein-domain-containing protein [Hyaloraphidium curvatum]
MGGAGGASCSANVSSWAGRAYLPKSGLHTDPCDLPARVAVWSTNATHRTLTTNSLPDYAVYPYCPKGYNESYCVTDSECSKLGWSSCLCAYPGDCPSPKTATFSVPIAPETGGADHVPVGKAGDLGYLVAGTPIYGPTDAGGVDVDDTGFPFTCGGHVTPGFIDSVQHYHKAADCYFPNITSTTHSPLIGYASDGHGIYGYFDINGSTPVVDECGGHWGPVPAGNPNLGETEGRIVYHYHARKAAPYYLGCTGPANGQCADVNTDATLQCTKGCGGKVCVQPGTDAAFWATLTGKLGYAVADVNAFAAVEGTETTIVAASTTASSSAAAASTASATASASASSVPSSGRRGAGTFSAPLALAVFVLAASIAV